MGEKNRITATCRFKIDMILGFLFYCCIFNNEKPAIEAGLLKNILITQGI